MELKVKLEGGKRVSTQIGDHLVMTDQPEKSGGTDTAPSPYDLFLASIATCSGFYLQTYCQNKDIDTSGIEIELSVTRDANHVIDGFVITLCLPEHVPEKLHGVFKKVVSQCTVKKTIMSNPGFTVEVRKH